MGPKIALKIFLSKTPKIASSDFDNEDKDMNKILSGNMWAVYAEYPQPHCVDVKNTIFKVSLRVNVCKMYQRAHAAGVYWCLLCARVCVYCHSIILCNVTVWHLSACQRVVAPSSLELSCPWRGPLDTDDEGIMFSQNVDDSLPGRSTLWHDRENHTSHSSTFSMKFPP